MNEEGEKEGNMRKEERERGAVTYKETLSLEHLESPQVHSLCQSAAMETCGAHTAQE